MHEVTPSTYCMAFYVQRAELDRKHAEPRTHELHTSQRTHASSHHYECTCRCAHVQISVPHQQHVCDSLPAYMQHGWQHACVALAANM